MLIEKGAKNDKKKYYISKLNNFKLNVFKFNNNNKEINKNNFYKSRNNNNNNTLNLKKVNRNFNPKKISFYNNNNNIYNYNHNIYSLSNDNIIFPMLTKDYEIKKLISKKFNNKYSTFLNENNNNNKNNNLSMNNHPIVNLSLNSSNNSYNSNNSFYNNNNNNFYSKNYIINYIQTHSVFKKKLKENKIKVFGNVIKEKEKIKFNNNNNIFRKPINLKKNYKDKIDFILNNLN